jgi:type I restriction enzyme R subunit
MVPPPPKHPEQRARVQIDAMLNAAGWDIQDRQDLNLAAAAGVAVREFRTHGGPADYLLFLRNQLVGVIEAGTGIETWFRNGLDPDARARGRRGPDPRLLQEGFEPAAGIRAAAAPCGPAAPTLQVRMRLASGRNTAGMWPAQFRAVQNLAASFRDSKPRALVQTQIGSPFENG